MRVVTIPENCSRREFLLCVKTALKTLVPYGKALVILDEKEIPYNHTDEEETHSYKYCSDTWLPEEIVHGQSADLIAIENPRHFTKEGIAEVITHVFNETENKILLVQERKS